MIVFLLLLISYIGGFICGEMWNDFIRRKV